MQSWRWRFLMFCMRHSDLYLTIHHRFTTILRKPHTPLIFCIGYPKTGTSSLYYALRILGYRTVRLFKIGSLMSHPPSFQGYLDELERNKWIPFILQMKKYQYDAFIDFPMAYDNLYVELDQAFPQSRFILTLRDTVGFASSYTRYFTGSPWEASTPNDLKREVEEFENYNQKVQRYFCNRPNQLLCLDIIGGEGWPEICSFLEEPIPKKPFPRKNVSKPRKVR
jgi:hypothetical protein